LLKGLTTTKIQLATSVRRSVTPTHRRQVHIILYVINTSL